MHTEKMPHKGEQTSKIANPKVGGEGVQLEHILPSEAQREPTLPALTSDPGRQDQDKKPVKRPCLQCLARGPRSHTESNAFQADLSVTHRQLETHPTSQTQVQLAENGPASYRARKVGGVRG